MLSASLNKTFSFLLLITKMSENQNNVDKGATCSSGVKAFAHCVMGHRMYYAVCGIMHIKEALLLIGKSSQCGGSEFPMSLSEWSFTICLTQYNRK